MYSKKVLEQVTKAFNAIRYTQESRRKDGMISHMLDKRFYESRYTIAEKRCYVLRSYVKAYDRQRESRSEGSTLPICRVYLTASTPLYIIMASLLGSEDGARPETMEVNEALSLARLAIAAMDTEDRA